MNYRLIKESLYSLLAIPYKVAMKNNCNKVYNRRIKINNLNVDTPVFAEDEHVRKWRQLDRSVTPFYYRFFSNYIKPDVNIAPEYTTHVYIEPILNPLQYRDYYEEKNIYDLMFPKGYLPDTILRSINGCFMDKKYFPIDISDGVLVELCNNYDRIIVKPTVDSSSGHGIMMFVKSNDKFVSVNKDSDVLSVDLLQKNYRGNFIIQEYLTQSDFLAQFNPTSVNTIRIHAYRSVKTNEVHLIGSILRIGASGSFCDNAHAGGLFIGIVNGRLSNCLYNQWGESFDSFNGIDFSKETFIIPNYDKIENFAKQVAKKILHHRSIALDITLDKNNNPRLIEFNLSGFSSWLFQFTVGTAYGDFTDEVIEYCSRCKKNSNLIIGNNKTFYYHE